MFLVLEEWIKSYFFILIAFFSIIVLLYNNPNYYMRFPTYLLINLYNNMESASALEKRV